MKRCPQCNKEVSDTAKFCGGCGYKFAAAGAVCPKCGNPGSGKFCGKCGTPLAPQQSPASQDLEVTEQTVNAPKPEITVTKSYLNWNILPGQLAVKIDESDIASYGNGLKGINIQDGVKALFFVSGKLVSELSSGHYPFKNWEDERPAEERAGILKRGFTWFCNAFLPESWKEKADNLGWTTQPPSFSFVLIRTNEFPLVFNFTDVPTSTLSCNIGLHFLCKISNINNFYTAHLSDQKFIGFEKIARRLEANLKKLINYSFLDVDPEKISRNPEMAERIQATLKETITQIYPYIQLSRVINISAQNEDLDNFRRMAEELYISERELIELTKRNDFLNRFQAVQNEQELYQLRAGYSHENAMTDADYAQEEHVARRDSLHSVTMQGIANTREMTELRMESTHDIDKSKLEAEHHAIKEKIYEEMALTDDERAKFDLMLSAQAQLREAKTEEEIAAAMHTFRKSGLLREQEIENMQHQIAQQAELRDLNDAQVLAMTTMQNQMALDQQKLEWEIQIGNKRIQNQFDRQRIEDAYNDERRDKEYNFTDQRREKDADFSDSRREADARYEDSRRQANIDFDRQEQENQLDLLQKAQNIRMQREAAEHQREMESAEAARRHELESQKLAQDAEKNRLDAANEEKRIYAGMTFEQIMAANPNLTPQAAQALAKKYEAEAATAQAQAAMAQNDKIAQMAMDQKDQMMAFMQQQMAMMKDLSMAGINAGAAHQQAMYNEKQAELDRTRADAVANSDRFVDGMKTTIQAVGNMGNTQQAPQQAPQQPAYQQVVYQAPQPQYQQAPQQVPPQAASQGIKCPNCGQENPAGAAFCSECGESF